MNDEEFHQQADELAVAIENEISETEEFINGLPEFEERSEKARRLQRAIENQ